MTTTNDWQQRSKPFILTNHNGFSALRDDLIDGGTKVRFLSYVMGDADHIVYGSPFAGGAPVAMSVIGRETGKRITIFYAHRNDLHPRMQRVQNNGAHLQLVPHGYMNVVQKRARDYAQQTGALFLPLGFDTQSAVAPLQAMLETLNKQIGQPDEIWCAAGSGMLAKNLAVAFPNSQIKAVAVGLQSRWSKQTMPPNCQILEQPLLFAKPLKVSAPFPICLHYESKAFAMMQKAIQAQPQRSRLFWNVIGWEG
jgi:hypothetical protein